MSAKLKKIIEESLEKITMPNDCYNSSIINILYKRNSGNSQYKEVKASLFYGKQLQIILWENGSPIFEETLSTLSLKYKDGIFSNRFLSLKL